MKANTALCLLALAAATGRLVPGHRWLPVPVLVVTLMTLSEHLTGGALGIDELLVDDFTYSPGSNPPGRMAIVVPSQSYAGMIFGVVGADALVEVFEERSPAVAHVS